MSDTAHIDQYPPRPQVFYGRGVWELGEDGEWGVMVEGHGRRAYAALCAQVREAQGGPWWRDDIRAAKPVGKWVRFIETCGCTEEEHAGHADRDGGCDDVCHRSGLPPCDPERYAWAWDTVAEGESGALPVIEVRW